MVMSRVTGRSAATRLRVWSKLRVRCVRHAPLWQVAGTPQAPVWVRQTPSRTRARRSRTARLSGQRFVEITARSLQQQAVALCARRHGPSARACRPCGESGRARGECRPAGGLVTALMCRPRAVAGALHVYSCDREHDPGHRSPPSPFLDPRLPPPTLQRGIHTLQHCTI